MVNYASFEHQFPKKEFVVLLLLLLFFCKNFFAVFWKFLLCESHEHSLFKGATYLLQINLFLNFFTVLFYLNIVIINKMLYQSNTWFLKTCNYNKVYDKKQ